MSLLSKLGLTGVILLIGISLGWWLHQWKSNSDQLISEKASEKAYREAAKKAEDVGTNLQLAIDKIGENKLSSTKEVFHETAKIEYRCILPESGRLLYNSAVATGTGSP